MTQVRDAAIGIWEFIAGDDWVTAAGAVLALVLTSLVGDENAAWLVLPVAVGFLLAVSIWRAARKDDQPTYERQMGDQDA
jgi:hypothetical protein